MKKADIDVIGDKARELIASLGKRPIPDKDIENYIIRGAIPKQWRSAITKGGKD